MKDNTEILQQLPDIWPHYRSNLPRTLGRLTTVIESRTMDALINAGHEKLNIGLGSPITLLSNKPRRLTDLARRMGVSKQLCLQSLRPVETAGYISRKPDPEDGRAKIIYLSARGQQLVKDALRELTAIEDDLVKVLGKRLLNELTKSLQMMYATGEDNQILRFGLPSIIGEQTRRLQKQLMLRASEMGYQDLQPSFSHVLENIDLSGTSISAIAQQQSISLPAVSRIAQELEHRGFLRRFENAADKRSRKLLFTPFGLQLITDAVINARRIEGELEQKLGTQRFTAMREGLNKLHHTLAGGQALIGDYDALAAAKLFGEASHSPKDKQPSSPKTKIDALIEYAAELDGNSNFVGEALTQKNPSGDICLRSTALAKLAAARADAV